MLRMADRITGAIIGALTLALIGVLAGLVDAGPLDPGGPPGSTPGVRLPGTPVSQPASPAGFPIVVDEPGLYYLVENITGVAGENGILIAADNVTLDLNGFSLEGVANSGSGIVVDAAGYENLAVRDGTVSRWANHAIDAHHGSKGTYTDLRISANSFSGIVIDGPAIVRDSVIDGNQVGIDLAIGGDGTIITGNAIVVPANSTGIRANETAFSDAEGSRIMGNQITTTDVSAVVFDIDSTDNFIISNTLYGPSVAVTIAAGNTVGPFVLGTDPIATTNPWANFYAQP